jgi:hypothetical protein
MLPDCVIFFEVYASTSRSLITLMMQWICSIAYGMFVTLKIHRRIQEIATSARPQTQSQNTLLQVTLLGC